MEILLINLNFDLVTGSQLYRCNKCSNLQHIVSHFKKKRYRLSSLFFKEKAPIEQMKSKRKCLMAVEVRDRSGVRPLKGIFTTFASK